MKKLYFTLLLYFKSYIRSEYSFFYTLVMMLILLISYSNPKYSILFYLLTALQYYYYYKKVNKITPVIYRYYDLIIYSLIQSLLLFLFYFLSQNKYAILITYVCFIIIPLLKIIDIKRISFIMKINTFDIFSLSYLRSFNLFFIFLIGYFLAFYLHFSYQNLGNIIILSLLINYIYSSSYTTISSYLSELNLIIFYNNKFENYFEKKVILSLFLINIPFLFFIQSFDNLSFFFVNILNHYLSIRSYYLIEKIYYHNKSKIFPNKLAIGIMSIVPYLILFNFTNYIILSRKIKNNA